MKSLIKNMSLITGIIFPFGTFAEPQYENEFVVIGVAALPEYGGAKDAVIFPFIVSRFSIFDAEVELEGLEGRIDFVSDSVWRMGPALSITIPRYNDIKAVAVAALPEIDLAVELGGFVGFEIPFSNMKEGTLSGLISARQDVTGRHDGLLTTANVEYFFAVNPMLRFGLAVNATYANDAYMDTYFGVNANGASASGLEAFQANGGLKDIGAEIYSILSFNPTWGIFSRFSYNQLLSDAANSPIVETAGSPNQYFVGAGVFYRF